MRSRKGKMRSVFSFLLVCSLLVPIQARAAETVTREKTFQTEENSEEAFAQQSGIADLVEEDVSELVKGSFLEHADRIRVSAFTGQRKSTSGTSKK